MLIVSLSFSLLLLLLADRTVRRSPNALAVLAVYALLGIFLPLLVQIFLPAAALQAVLTPFVYLAWRWGRWPHGAFTALSAATVVAAYVGFGLLHLHRDRPDRERLRAKYPYESMEDRVPPAPPAARPAELSAVAAARLTEMEQAVQGRANSGWRDMLVAVHEMSVREFLESPGFGVGRMDRFGGPHSPFWALTFRQQAVPQPALKDAPGWQSDSPGDLVEMRPGDEDQLARMHGDSVLDFVKPGGFGLVKDRRHVAGFLPHQFSQVPKPGERWSVGSVELVSLLLHDEPRVYVSANLPKMDQLRGVPTRPLDDIETAGLKALQGGEDLFMRPTEEGLRLLGSLRAVKQCVACHDGQRGDLLGAFSYTLRPARR